MRGICFVSLTFFLIIGFFGCGEAPANNEIVTEVERNDSDMALEHSAESAKKESSSVQRELSLLDYLPSSPQKAKIVHPVVNVRSEATTDSDIIGQVKKSEMIIIKDIVDAGKEYWFKINHNGKEGNVRSDLAKLFVDDLDFESIIPLGEIFKKYVWFAEGKSIAIIYDTSEDEPIAGKLIVCEFNPITEKWDITWRSEKQYGPMGIEYGLSPQNMEFVSVNNEGSISALAVFPETPGARGYYENIISIFLSGGEVTKYDEFEGYMGSASIKDNSVVYKDHSEIVAEEEAEEEGDYGAVGPDISLSRAAHGYLYQINTYRNISMNTFNIFLDIVQTCPPSDPGSYITLNATYDTVNGYLYENIRALNEVEENTRIFNFEAWQDEWASSILDATKQLIYLKIKYMELTVYGCYQQDQSYLREAENYLSAIRKGHEELEGIMSRIN